VIIAEEYLGLVIEMWRDAQGRLWMDTGIKDVDEEIIIQLLDGSLSGALPKIAFGMPGGLTRVGFRKFK
jgi:hypothetical protein